MMIVDRCRCDDRILQVKQNNLLSNLLLCGKINIDSATEEMYQS